MGRADLTGEKRAARTAHHIEWRELPAPRAATGTLLVLGGLGDTGLVTDAGSVADLDALLGLEGLDTRPDAVLVPVTDPETGRGAETGRGKGTDPGTGADRDTGTGRGAATDGRTEARPGSETAPDAEARPGPETAPAVEAELNPLGQPEVDITELKDGETLNFTAEVDVRPTIEIPDYSGIE
ncbi:trigger factor family protein, partial [Streptomyces sp. e14]|uniref:trigger factor family protein n=1 Tax=Streptomyces sp. e14 TaxID=645465 RepID=UPI0022AE5532